MSKYIELMLTLNDLHQYHLNADNFYRIQPNNDSADYLKHFIMKLADDNDELKILSKYKFQLTLLNNGNYALFHNDKPMKMDIQFLDDGTILFTVFNEFGVNMEAVNVKDQNIIIDKLKFVETYHINESDNEDRFLEIYNSKDQLELLIFKSYIFQLEDETTLTVYNVSERVSKKNFKYFNFADKNLLLQSIPQKYKSMVVVWLSENVK